MKLLLTALLSVGIFVNVCNAACHSHPPKERKGRDPGGCRHEGKTHSYGSTWRIKDCVECKCSSDGSVTCCDVGGRPVNYDTEKCTAILDKEACVYHVVKNANPCQTCEHGMIG